MNGINERLVVLFCFIAVLGILYPTPAAHAQEKPSKPTEGIASEDPNFGEGKTESLILELGLQSFDYLKEGHSYIMNNGDGTVSVSGSTKAYNNVNIIGVNLYLQRWNASTSEWEDVISVGDYTLPYSSFVTGGADVTIVKGYYYRTRATHWVSKGGNIEQNNSVTTYIYVN